MSIKSYLFLLIIVPVWIAGCRDKKADPGEEKPLTAREFLALFPEKEGSLRVTDSALMRKQTDSGSVKHKIYAPFIPDSAFSGYFGKTHPVIYPLGKKGVDKAETYLLVKASGSGKTVAYLLVFDADRKFVAARPVLKVDKSAATFQQAELDNRFTLTILKRRKAAEGQEFYRKDAFVYSEGAFILILAESNEKTGQETKVINPLDTLPRRNKYSGDYVANAKNFVSIRDGIRPGTYRFFIHFEKDKGTCTGELKGEAEMKGSRKAIYTQANGPCEIEFTFNNTSLSIRETGPCGSFRGIKCFFEGLYRKKKLKT